MCVCWINTALMINPNSRISPKTFHMIFFCSAMPNMTARMFSPVWHKVWWWEHSSVAFLSGVPHWLSAVDVPHLSVLRPNSEQFVWGWHGLVEEPPGEKWPSGQSSHTVSLTGVPGRDLQRYVLQMKTDRSDTSEHVRKHLTTDFFSHLELQLKLSHFHHLVQKEADVILRTAETCESSSYWERVSENDSYQS